MNRFLQRVRRRTSSLCIHALAALFLLGYVASFAHDVSVRHSLCAEHGEWVHDAVVTCEAGCATGADDDSPQIRSVTQKTEVAHEHCVIVIATRGGRWLTPSAPVAISEPAGDAVRHDVDVAVNVREPCIWSASARGPPMSV